MNEVLKLARWRVRLFLKQKMVLAAAVFGLVGFVLSFFVASSSYLYPIKIYWDFALGLSFALSVLLAVVMSTQFVSEERQRRTCHLILASGISRRSWLLGNSLGVIFALLILVGVWSILSLFVSYLLPADPGFQVAGVLKAQMALSFELVVVVSMGVFLSIFLRPLLALILCLSLVFFLHSQISLLNVLLDPQTGAFNNPLLLPFVQFLLPFLPPLEWYDLRIHVGYPVDFSWGRLGLLGIMSLAWSAFFLEMGLLKFQKIDL